MKRRRFTLSFLALLLLGVAATPWLLRLGVERLFLALGAEEVAVRCVTLNPFTARLALEGLSVRVAGREGLRVGRLDLDLALLPLLSRHAVVEALALDDLHLEVEAGSDGPRIAGLALPPPAAGDGGPAWGVVVERLALRNGWLLYRAPGEERTLRLDRVELTGLRSEERALAPLFVAGALEGAWLRFEGGVDPFAPRLEGRLGLRGYDLSTLTVHLPREAALAGRVTLESDLSLTAVGGGFSLDQQLELHLADLAAAAAGGSVAGRSLTWSGAVELELGKEVAAEARGGLRGEALKVMARDTSATVAGLVADPLKVHVAGGEPSRPKVEGNVALSGVVGELPAGHLAAARIAWNGRAGLEGEALPFAGGEVRLKSVEMSHAGVTLAALGAGEILGFEFKGERLAFSSARLERLALLAEGAAPGVATINEVSLAAGGRFSPDGGAALGPLVLAGVAAELRRGPDGVWLPLARLERGTADRGAVDGKEGGADGGAMAPRLRLAGVRIEGDSRITFDDRAVEPAYRETLRLERFDLGALDSATPAARTSLDLAARVGQYAKVAFAGAVAPLASSPELTLKGTLESLELPPLSAYTARELGYNLSSGQLDAEFDLAIEKQSLSGENRLVIHNITVEPISEERRAQLEQQLAMPLESALGMLQDDANNVRLTLPVSGSLSDPKFDLGDAINQAMGKAVRTAAVSYLKFSLQPFGLLVSLVQVAGEAAQRVRLDPLHFAPGSGELDTEAQRYLEKMAGLMGERPQLRLRLCGYAVDADRGALSAAKVKEAELAGRLEALARARAEGVRGHLVERHGVDPKRLFVCNPKVDAGEPRVEPLI